MDLTPYLAVSGIVHMHRMEPRSYGHWPHAQDDPGRKGLGTVLPTLAPWAISITQQLLPWSLQGLTMFPVALPWEAILAACSPQS